MKQIALYLLPMALAGLLVWHYEGELAKKDAEAMANAMAYKKIIVSYQKALNELSR